MSGVVGTIGLAGALAITAGITMTAGLIALVSKTAATALTGLAAFAVGSTIVGALGVAPALFLGGLIFATLAAVLIGLAILKLSHG